MNICDNQLSERMEYRTAIIRNLPEEPDEEKMKELFADAPNINIVRDQDGKCKGYVNFIKKEIALDILMKTKVNLFNLF